MEQLLTLDEVAAQVAVPPASLRYWCHIGSGPASIKVGRHIRYRQSDVDAWLEAGQTGPLPLR